MRQKSPIRRLYTLFILVWPESELLHPLMQITDCQKHTAITGLTQLCTDNTTFLLHPSSFSFLEPPQNPTLSPAVFTVIKLFKMKVLSWQTAIVRTLVTANATNKNDFNSFYCSPDGLKDITKLGQKKALFILSVHYHLRFGNWNVWQSIRHEKGSLIPHSICSPCHSKRRLIRK